MEMERDKFFKFFSSKVGDSVQSIELVNISAPLDVFKKMNLAPQVGTNVLWGLLVFCTKGLFFYVHSSESAMGGLFRAAAHGDLPPEQMLNFNELDNFNVVDRKPKWYDFLSFETKHQIEIEFFSSEKKYNFKINTQNKAEIVIAKIKAYK